MEMLRAAEEMEDAGNGLFTSRQIYQTMAAHNWAQPVPVDDPHRGGQPNVKIGPNCPRCNSSNNKFCYYNNCTLSQPRYFCNDCRRYWTEGGSIRNVPIGGPRASHKKPQPVRNEKPQIRNESILELKKNRGIGDMEPGLPPWRTNVYQDLQGGSSSSRTTNTAGTLMMEVLGATEEMEDAANGLLMPLEIDQTTAAPNLARPVPVDDPHCGGQPNVKIGPNCPRCNSSNNKFCYYNNYILSQPRYFCNDCRRYWTEGASLRNVPIRCPRASHKKRQPVRNEKPQLLNDRISKLKNIGYHEMDGTELGEAKEIWSCIQRLPNRAEIRAVVPHFRSMLRSFTNDDGGVQPTTLSHRRFRNYCFTLLSKLVGDTIRGSAGSVREHGGITDIESGLPYFVRRPNVYQYLRGMASSSRTTNTAGTLMGDGRRHNQAPKMKEFRNFAYWITALFITILISLLSANKRQPQVLFRLCGGLVIGATICCIAMLMLILIRPPSQRSLNCLKLMQYLTIGLLFLVAVLVFTLL